MVKSSFFKKPGRKSRYLAYLAEFLPSEQVKLPPVPVSTRWNSWFAAVIYRAAQIHLYHGFFSVSVLCPLAEESQGIALKRIVELCGHKEIYPEILLQVHFITENCPRHVTNLTSLEATHDPLACTVYNTMEDLRAYLKAGTTTNSFVPESDRLLGKLKGQEKTKQRFPGLAAVAQDAIWMPVDASVDVERSFSQYKHLMDDRREGLTEANTKQLLMLYYTTMETLGTLSSDG
ncbi:uncharacterized protein LOC116218253 [Clupea harengus]|uniref:Uncharacterized protein LOC116218253 n=1 Tax=Clupea harengus TaxID=7950 RepID=A0A6P8EVS9_CLUHA|nr:uncharacterized protein LOC116218253 [Clupea harengus]